MVHESARVVEGESHEIKRSRIIRDPELHKFLSTKQNTSHNMVKKSISSRPEDK